MCRLIKLCISAMHVQMDRSWVHSTVFSTEYVNGVKEFIKEKFGENDEILCLCTRCLNQKYLHQPNVKKHILLNCMDCTYTRWVHHGEDISVHVNVVPAPAPVFDTEEGSIHGMDVAEDDNNDVVRLDSEPLGADKGKKIVPLGARNGDLRLHRLVT